MHWGSRTAHYWRVLRETFGAVRLYDCLMTIELHSIDDARLAQVFKALSDPTRIAILRYLKDVGRGVTCGEVSSVIDMSKSTGSYHFRQLRDAGLTVTRKESREKYVSINKETFDAYVSGFYDRL